MKKKFLALLMGTSLCLGLAACGGGTSSTDTSKSNNNGGGGSTSNNTANAGDAQKIFNQKCSSCHGNNLEGKVGPNLQHIGGQLSKSQILDILKNGKSGGMPAGLVTGSDANAIATWLASKK